MKTKNTSLLLIVVLFSQICFCQRIDTDLIDAFTKVRTVTTTLESIRGERCYVKGVISIEKSRVQRGLILYFKMKETGSFGKEGKVMFKLDSTAVIQAANIMPYKVFSTGEMASMMIFLTPKDISNIRRYTTEEIRFQYGVYTNDLDIDPKRWGVLKNICKLISEYKL